MLRRRELHRSDLDVLSNRAAQGVASGRDLAANPLDQFGKSRACILGEVLLRRGREHGELVRSSERLQVRDVEDEGETVGQRHVERFRADVLEPVAIFTVRPRRRVHGSPAMMKTVERHALHTPLVHDREQLVLQVGPAARDFVEEDRLCAPDRRRRLEIRQLAGLGYGEADQIVEVEQRRVVVSMLQAECFRKSRQDQRLGSAVRSDQEERRLRRERREDHRLEVIPADDAKFPEEAGFGCGHHHHLRPTGRTRAPGGTNKRQLRSAWRFERKPRGLNDG